MRFLYFILLSGLIASSCNSGPAGKEITKAQIDSIKFEIILHNMTVNRRLTEEKIKKINETTTLAIEYANQGISADKAQEKAEKAIDEIYSRQTNYKDHFTNFLNDPTLTYDKFIMYCDTLKATPLELRKVLAK